MKSKPSEIDTLVPAAEQRIEFLKIELKKAEEELARLNREKESAPRLNIICEQNDLFSSKSPADGVGKGISVIPETRVNRDSCLPDKIMLIRSLFRVRTDVFARRWESSKTGKSGFLPACANEWVRGVCRKPEVKCGDCPAREFLPLSDSVIEKHLTGYEYDPKRSWGNPRDFIIGIYPLFPDENCWFLAADFDGPTWAQDIGCFRDCARRHGVPVTIERSRSGQGGHAWIFFDEAVPAITARRLGTFLLTQTLDERPEVGFKSYDRLFPNQDFMPEGGFGNLIALPLQGRAAEQGNTLFLDDGLQPHEDQWAFLSSIPRISKADSERIVEEARRLGKILGVRLPAADEDDEEPWKWTPSRKKPDKIIEGPLPRNVKIVLSDLIYVEKTDLPPLLRNRLIRLAAFQNPEFYKAQALRLSTFGKPRIISCAEDFSKYIGLPRGCRDEIIDFFSSFGIEISASDERTVGRPLKVEFKGTLLADQENAFKALAEHDLGVLAAATAFGKTVVAAKMIAERAVNTIVFVHRRQILDQWKNQLSIFLGIPADNIGEIGGGKRRPSGLIDIALIQSLSRDGKVDDIVADCGQIIVDECHHIPAYSFEQVARRCRAKYFLGLSATVVRKDGHHPIIFMQCGPVRFHVSARQGAATHPFDHKTYFKETGVLSPSSSADEKAKIHEIYDFLIRDEARNMLIFEDVMKCIAEEKRSPIILTERRDHLEILAEKFRAFVKHVLVFQGGLGRKQRRALYEKMRSIPDGDDRLLIATGRYLGEGFDDARLDTLFLTLPISWKGTLAQYAGRLHRQHYGKREVRIYDYVDSRIPLLEKMQRRRISGYRSIGYEIVSDRRPDSFSNQDRANPSIRPIH